MPGDGLNGRLDTFILGDVGVEGANVSRDKDGVSGERGEVLYQL